jgi:hypothetical protein
MLSPKLFLFHSLEELHTRGSPFIEGVTSTSAALPKPQGGMDGERPSKAPEEWPRT